VFVVSLCVFSCGYERKRVSYHRYLSYGPDRLPESTGTKGPHMDPLSHLSNVLRTLRLCGPCDSVHLNRDTETKSPQRRRVHKILAGETKGPHVDPLSLWTLCPCGPFDLNSSHAPQSTLSVFWFFSYSNAMLVHSYVSRIPAIIPCIGAMPVGIHRSHFVQNTIAYVHMYTEYVHAFLEFESATIFLANRFTCS
jgi:hypothetical protein